MNQIISFHKELNYKKIIIFSILIILLLILIFTLIFKSHKVKKNENSTKKFISQDSNIQVELSNNYKLTQYDNNNYDLSLKSDENLDIFIKKYLKSDDNLSLNQIATIDNQKYINNFEKYANVSGLSQFNFQNTTCYTYCFHYLDNDKKTAYYLQCFWLENNNNYYSIDIEFPLEKLQDYSKLINDFFNTLVIN